MSGGEWRWRQQSPVISVNMVVQFQQLSPVLLSCHAGGLVTNHPVQAIGASLWAGKAPGKAIYPPRRPARILEGHSLP